MTVNRRIGLGFTLGVDPTGGSSFTVLAAIVDGWKGASAKREEIDISILSDVSKLKAPGQLDPGTVTFVIAYDPLDSVTTQVLNTMLMQTSLVAPNWQVSFPAGTGSVATETFLGFVVGQDRTIDRGKLCTSEVTIMVSGTPGYTL